jgi:hypothetical protein
MEISNPAPRRTKQVGKLCTMEISNPAPRARPSIAVTDGFPASNREKTHEKYVMQPLDLLI